MNKKLCILLPHPYVSIEQCVFVCKTKRVCVCVESKPVCKAVCVENSIKVKEGLVHIVQGEW